MDFKIIKLRVCSQCGDKVPARCDSCVKHPDRKPTIQTRYALPAVLETCASGHCVKIACQVDDALRPAGCARTAWKSTHHAKAPRVWADLFCGKRCAAVMTGAKRRARKQTVTCDNHKCDRGPGGTRKKFPIFDYKLKVDARHHCCRSCKWIGQQIRKHTPPPVNPIVTYSDIKKVHPESIFSTSGRLISQRLTI